MRTYSIMFLLSLWMVANASWAQSAAPAAPATGQLAVDLTIAVSKATDTRLAKVVPTLTIRNLGSADATVADPANRMALALLVLDDSGLPVPPRGIAKVHDAIQKVTIKAGQSLVRELGGLQFLTKGALFDYELVAGQTYRVIALYRPAGDTGGICTREVDFKME